MIREVEFLIKKSIFSQSLCDIGPKNRHESKGDYTGASSTPILQALLYLFNSWGESEGENEAGKSDYFLFGMQEIHEDTD